MKTDRVMSITWRTATEGGSRNPPRCAPTSNVRFDDDSPLAETRLHRYKRLTAEPRDWAAPDESGGQMARQPRIGSDRTALVPSRAAASP